MLPLQIGEIVDRGRAGEAVEVARAVAPVGERPVDVDADGVDVGRGPQRVEVEVDVARAVGRLMAEVLRPVGGVGDLGAGAEHGLHVGGERRERGDERIGAGAVAHPGEAAHLRADDEGVDAAGRGGEVGVVQDEAAVGPLGGAGVDDAAPSTMAKSETAAVPTKAATWVAAAAVLSGRAGLAGRGRDGDAAAPGIERLRGGAGVGVGQRVAGGDVHEDEGRERDGEAARLEVLDGGDHGLVGRRAAVGRAAVDRLTRWASARD